MGDSGLIKVTIKHHTQILEVLHAQLIVQLQSFPYDPKYIDLYRINTNLPQ